MSRAGAVKLGLLTAVAVLALLFATSATVSVTWDEPIYSQAAENAAHWFGTLLRPGPAAAFEQTAFGIGWGLVNEHPPLVRVLNGFGWALTRGFVPAPVAHRIGTMALAALTVGVLAAATARRSAAAAGLFAAAALVTMPRVFFHAHLGALDFAHAATWFLATLGFYHAVSSHRSWAPLLAGLGLGLALLTKINAVLLLPYWGAWLLLYRRDRRAWLVTLLSLPVALGVVIAGWPWIWKDPVGGLADWVSFFRVHFIIRQWFAGHLYVQTPWYLPVAIVGITTPVILLALATFGALSGCTGVQTAAARRKASDEDLVSVPDWVGLQLLGVLVELGYYMLPITAIHDQDRLLLPAFLHIAVLAGFGFAVVSDRLMQLVDIKLTVGRAAASLVVGQAMRIGLAILLLLPGVLAVVRLHPFELSYYNELVGGIPGAERLGMETTYYASTYGYFLPELNRFPSGSKLWVMPNSWDVIYYYQRNGLLRDDIVPLRPPGWGSFYDDGGVQHAQGGLGSADYALIDRRQTTFNDVIPEYAIQLEWAHTKPEIARLERDGVLLAALYSK